MIYLDHNATTPLRPEALAALAEAVRQPGNPSSLHALGRAARRRLEEAREEIGRLVGAPRGRVVFTASGSEANTLAVLGLARQERARGRRRVLVSTVEHPCVRGAVERLREEGFAIETLPVGRDGVVDVDGLDRHLDAEVALVTVMLANNETGVLTPVAEVARRAAAYGVLVHTDAVQAVGKDPVHLGELGVASLALAGHKFGGPKGIGALVLAPGVSPEPLWAGGPQEEGLRPGTPAVALAAGLAAALEVAARQMERSDLAAHRDTLERHLSALPGAFVVGNGAPRLPNTTAVGLTGLPALPWVTALSEAGVMVSAGSACHSGEARPSAVLTAMGYSPERALEVVRFSTGWTTTAAEIEAAAGVVAQTARLLRAAA